MSASTHRTRRAQRRDEARRTILEAAAALLVDGGPGAFSMRRLAARCGYTLPTIYHHFGDKPGLLAALLDERFGELVDVLRRAPADGEPVARLRGMLRAVIDFGLSNPTHYALLVSALQEGSEPPAAEKARALFEEPILDLRAGGRLRPGDAEVAVQALWAFSHGVISLLTSGADVDWSPALLDAALDGMLHGVVLSHPARPEESSR